MGTATRKPLATHSKPITMGRADTHVPERISLMARFTNQAQLSYNDSTVSSNIVVGQLQEVLSATKTAVNTAYRPGDTVTYAVNLINSGAATVTGLTLTDDLGAYQTTAGATYVPLTYTDGTLRYFINGVLQATPTVTAGDTLTVSGISVPGGGNATLLYDALVNDYADPTGTGSITNTATVAGAGITTLTVAEAVPAASGARLSITKSISPVPVVENGILTYTFLIENTGNVAVDSTGNVTVTDTFLPVLSALTVTLDGTPLALTTDYTYDEATGSFATVPGKITVPAATFTQSENGVWSVTPGTATLTVSGTV